MVRLARIELAASCSAGKRLISRRDMRASHWIPGSWRVGRFPCCGDSRVVSESRLEVRQCPEHGRVCGPLACRFAYETRLNVAAGKIEALPTRYTKKW